MRRTAGLASSSPINLPAVCDAQHQYARRRQIVAIRLGVDRQHVDRFWTGVPESDRADAAA